MSTDDKIDNSKSQQDASITRNYLQEELYKKNVELNFVNEFLILTRELYAMSLLSLPPAVFAEKATTLIREKLEFEMVGVLTYKQDENLLDPVFIARSDKLVSVLRFLNFRFREIKINDFSSRELAKSMFEGKSKVFEGLSPLWGGLVTPENLAKIQSETNIKSVVVLPLMTEEHFIGVLVMALHTPYADLPEIEREQLKSFSDIIALSLDKAHVYKKLSEVNQSLVEANVSLLHANEELKGVDEMKSSILSSASHHLQNPLHNIVVGTSMLLDESFGKMSIEARRVAAQIFDAARHLNITFKMWVKVLDFENDKVEYKKDDFDIAALARDTLMSWKPSAEERGLSVFFEVNGELPFIVNADKEWIREVIINLIDNAFKMTEKGFVKVKVERIPKGVRVSVEDSGSGMSDETMKKLFRKFEKGKEGWKKDIYGTGLGLYLCKKIIEEGHGGKIVASSKGENKGSTFSFEISA